MPRRDDIIDIEGLRHLSPPRPESGGPRPWIAIRWQCCGTYSRVYRDRTGRFYSGTCPRCAKSVRVKVGPGGTNHRFFEAT